MGYMGMNRCNGAKLENMGRDVDMGHDGNIGKRLGTKSRNGRPKADVENLGVASESWVMSCHGHLWLAEDSEWFQYNTVWEFIRQVMLPGPSAILLLEIYSNKSAHRGTHRKAHSLWWRWAFWL